MDTLMLRLGTANRGHCCALDSTVEAVWTRPRNVPALLVDRFVIFAFTSLGGLFADAIEHVVEVQMVAGEAVISENFAVDLI